MFNRSDVGNDGMVRVWDVPDQCWKRVNAVDAREQIQKNTANMDGPEIEMKGPGGLKVVFQRDVPAHAEKGFVVVRAPEKALATHGAAAVERRDPEKVELGVGEKVTGGSAKDEPVDFTKYSTDELRGFAELSGKIKRSGQMTHAQLCEALDAAKYVPSTAPKAGSGEKN